MRRLSMLGVQKLTSRSVAPVVSKVSAFSTLANREMGEEIAYIRKTETANQAAIRADLERILAMEDDSAEKKELLEFVEDQKQPDGFFEKYGLDDWKFAVPIGMLVGIPLIHRELLVIDAEFQLTAIFVLFCSTMYTQLGPTIAKELDAGADAIFDDMKKVDDSLLAGIHNAIENNEMALSLEEDFTELYGITDEIYTAQAEVANYVEAHKYREAVVKKLDSLYALEEAASSAIRARMLTKIKADVISTFKTDKKAKEDAMAQAMAVLAAGAKGTMGKDVVGSVFGAALKSYKDSYAKMPAGSDDILNTLAKDVAAVGTAPTPEGTGGNVYAM